MAQRADKLMTLFATDGPRRRFVFRPASNVTKTSLVIDGPADGKRYASAELQSSDLIDFTKYTMLQQRPIFGCLGIVSVNNELFIGCVTDATKSAELEGNPIYRIVRVAFHSLTSTRYDGANDLVSQVPLGTTMTTTTIPDEPVVHPCQPLIKLLTGGSFYFSQSFDLTRSLQFRANDAADQSLFDQLEPRFVWNHRLLGPFLHMRESELDETEKSDLDSSGILLPIIQGFVGAERAIVKGLNCKLVIISRLSCLNAGTRFKARGTNDEGHVSNFVETEFLLYSDLFTFSFLQIRGSVPIFWEQTGMQMSHKVTISRGMESTRPATKKHFEDLVDRYGKVQVVNLLGQSPASHEYELSEAYKSSLAGIGDVLASIDFLSFDFNAIIKYEYDRVEELTRSLGTRLEDLSYYLFDPQTKTTVFSQRGVVRTNCLDCLDRTNLVQCYIAKKMTEVHFRQFRIHVNAYDEDQFVTRFNNLWADNADWLSKIYAGTGALKSSYTRKGKSTVFGFLDDAAKSVNRFYVSNFQDNSRQEAIDMLLAVNVKNVHELLRNPVHEQVLRALHERESSFVSLSDVTVFLGTYNINGKLPSNESLESWLESRLIEETDIVIIGIQELIELTPGQYISANTDQLRLIWESTLMKALNSRPGRNYVLLRSLHLVALAMFAFVKGTNVTNVKQVETSVIKTGLGGMAANKGGIGISFLYNDTSMAFITAHFAAGTNAVEERNRDYWTITNGLKFRRRRLPDHDMIFWFGDFNYRLKIANEEARARIASGDYFALSSADQLKSQMDLGLAFPEFVEGPLMFPPTYKYDNGSTLYDTSEKARTPSWTDRILYKGERIALVEYARGEQLLSDHRPVRGIFQVFTKIINHAERDRLQKSLYQSLVTGEKLPPANISHLQTTKERSLSNPQLPARREPPPLPARNRLAKAPTISSGAATFSSEPQSSQTGVLIDLGTESKSNVQNPFESSALFDRVNNTTAEKSNLPPPSSLQGKWWDRDINESWIPYEGSGKNPFYPLVKPHRVSKALSIGPSIGNQVASISASQNWTTVPRTVASQSTVLPATQSLHNPFQDFVDPWGSEQNGYKSLMD